MHNSFNEEDFDIRYEAWLESIGGVEHLENFIKVFNYVELKNVKPIIWKEPRKKPP